MRKDDNTGLSAASQHDEPSFDEPIRRWSNLPITENRARELVTLLINHGESALQDALIELICGLMPASHSNDMQDLDKRRDGGEAALMHAFTYTHRAGNELGAYVVHLKCAEWEWKNGGSD
jgi:hypothetical protein